MKKRGKVCENMQKYKKWKKLRKCEKRRYP